MPVYFCKMKTAYEFRLSLVGSEMGIRARRQAAATGRDEDAVDRRLGAVPYTHLTLATTPYV